VHQVKGIVDRNLWGDYLKKIDPRVSLDQIQVKLIEFEPGECLCEQGYALDYLFFLVKGKVKIYVTSSEGKRLIVTFNRPVQIFGDIELIQKVNVLNTIEAVSTVHAFAIPVETANKLCMEAAFNQYLLEVVGRKFLTKSMTLSFHLLNEADARFASYLFSISHNENGQFYQPFIAKKDLKEIAEFIGTTVRHQNRIIQIFQQEGILERAPDGIKISDPNLLKEKAKDNLYEMQ